MRPNELKMLKTDLNNKIEALNQIISHIEELTVEVKLKLKQLKKKIKKILKENPFNFTEYVEKQKEEGEIDLGLFVELAENKIINNQLPVNSLIEDVEKLKKVYFTNGYFSQVDEGEIDTNRFLKDRNELAKLIAKKLDKFDNNRSIIYTGNIYRYLNISNE